MSATANGQIRKYGKGFTASNLLTICRFYSAFPIQHALRAELSWTHYRTILKIEHPPTSNWSTRELDRQMNSMPYERLALSKDKNGIMALARNGQILQTPSDMVKDRYVLVFPG